MIFFIDGGVVKWKFSLATYSTSYSRDLFGLGGEEKEKFAGFSLFCNSRHFAYIDKTARIRLTQQHDFLHGSIFFRLANSVALKMAFPMARFRNNDGGRASNDFNLRNRLGSSEINCEAIIE